MSRTDMVELESLENELDTTSNSSKHYLKTTNGKKSALKPIRKKNPTSVVLCDTTLESPAVSPESSTVSLPSSIGSQSPPDEIEDYGKSKIKFYTEHKTETNSVKKSYQFTLILKNRKSKNMLWRPKKSIPTKESSSSKIVTPIKVDSNKHTKVSIDHTPAPTCINPVQPESWIQHFVQSPAFGGFTLNPLNNSFEPHMIQQVPSTIPSKPSQKNDHLTMSKDVYLPGMMSIRFLEDDYTLTPYTGYVTCAKLHTLVLFHKNIVTIIETHPKTKRNIIKIPSLVQIVAITDTRLLVLTQDARVILYDTITSKMVGEIKELEISHKDIFGIHEMILHNNNDFSFKMNDSLYIASLDNVTNLKKIADNVTILNGRSMFIAYSTIRKKYSEGEKDDDKEQVERSIEVYDVAKGITKSALQVKSGVRVSASKKYLYITHKKHLKVYSMADDIIVLSIIIKDLLNQDLVHYNTNNELWILKKDKNLYKYSKGTGRFLHGYNLNMDDRVVHPNDDWTAFQIGKDLVSLTDFKIARFGDFYDKNALVTQVILPQRVHHTLWTEFNGEIALQRSPKEFHIANIINGTMSKLLTRINSTSVCLWPQGIYTKDYTHPNATYQFYIGDDISTSPTYTIHDVDPQNDHVIHMKMLPVGRVLIFLSHKATDTSYSYIECYDMSRTDEASPLWKSSKFKMFDIHNSPYIWDNMGKTLVEAYTGHILLKTELKVARSICTLGNKLYVLVTNRNLLQFTIPRTQCTSDLRYLPKVFRLETNYSQHPIITTFRIHNRDRNPTDFLIFFDGVTGNLGIRDSRTMYLKMEMNLGLPKSFTEKKNTINFGWSKMRFGKRQLWMSIKNDVGNVLLFRICTDCTGELIDGLNDTNY